MKLWSTGSGSAMASSLEISERSNRAFFSTRGWNEIVRAGVYAAGADWIDIALPKRFTYFARNLGYRGKSRTPLVESGRLRAGLLPRAYPEARATAAHVSLTLRLPTPTMTDSFGQSVGLTYYANPKVAEVLRRVTDAELERMGAVLAKTMQDLISGAEMTVSRKGKVRMALSTTQRASIAHTIKPQRSLAAAHVERK